LYQSAYDAYLNENFTGSIAACDSGLVQYSKNELAPKFMLLKAYCIARTSDERALKDQLSKLIKQWPETPETRKASEIIAYLNKQIPTLKVEEDKQIASEIYIDDKNSPHLFALIIQNASFNVNQATFDVISYNIDNYQKQNFRAEGTLVDNKYIMITVSGFADLKAAMDYYNSFRMDKIVRNASGSPMMTFIIGTKNLDALKKDKDPERYRLFFNEKYLSEGNQK
jgi:hypothetical protein